MAAIQFFNYASCFTSFCLYLHFSIMEVSDDIAKKRKVDFQLRKLAAGGSGGRNRRSCVTDDNSQAPLSSQWKFETPVRN